MRIVQFLLRAIVGLTLTGVLPLTANSFAEQTHAEMGRKVLAFYYTWYGNPQVSGRWFHWRNDESDFSLLDEKGLPFARSTNHPTIGLYDSNDPLVIAGHLKLAQKARIDALIATWWGQGDFTDTALKAVLDVADKMQSGTKVTVYYETVPDKNPRKATDDLLYILRNYGAKQSFLKVDGVPVVFLYGRAIGQLSARQWGEVAAAVKREIPVLLIADTDSRTKPNKADFDGFHFYNPVGRIKRGVNMNPFYEEYTQQYRVPGKILSLTIIPGYDDTHVRKPGTAVPRDNATLYKQLWFSAASAKPDWILITSWNEWHEGSEIEPSLEFGDLYLNLTSKYYLIFEEGRLTPRWEERISEIEGLLDEALAIIGEAEEKGLDARMMRRDLSIAQNVWSNFDYETAKLYLLRIKDGSGEVPEASVLWALPFIPILARSTARRRLRRSSPLPSVP